MKRHRVTRREFTKLAGGAVAAAGIGIRSGRARAAAPEIVVVGWGGAHEESFKKAMYDPFTAETGIRIKQMSNTNQLALLKAQVESNNPEWDVVQPGSLWIYRGAKEGLYEKIDYSVVDSSQLYKPAVHPYAVGVEVFAVDIAYNTKRFPAGSHPKTWAEFWDVKRFPGRRTAPGWTPRDNLEAAVMAAGVPISKVFPIDTKLAFEKLREIKPQMIWWNTGAQFAQMFADEEVFLGYGWGARVVVVAREGKPLAVEMNQGILDVGFFAISKISRNKENAMKFISFASGVKPQMTRPLLYPHGPVNRRAWEQLDPKARKDIVSFELPNTLIRDTQWWVDREAELLDQWKKFLAG